MTSCDMRPARQALVNRSVGQREYSSFAVLSPEQPQNGFAGCWQTLAGWRSGVCLLRGSAHLATGGFLVLVQEDSLGANHNLHVFVLNGLLEGLEGQRSQRGQPFLSILAHRELHVAKLGD